MHSAIVTMGERGNILTLAIVIGLICLGAPPKARGDVVCLKNGGQIRGEVQESAPGKEPNEITVLTLTGAMVSIEKDTVAFVTPRSLRIEEYETRAQATPDTIEAHWELAEWAREQNLRQQRAEQLEQIARLDPDHEKAQRGLGRARYDGKWMTRDEWMTSRGYIQHRGKYVTQQELDLIDKSEAQRQAERVWLGKVRLWVSWATGRDEGRRSEGMQRLGDIADPNAIAALVTELADHDNREARMFLVKQLSEMPDPRTVSPLVQQSLHDVDAQVREAAIQAIDDSKREHAISLYIAALGNEARLIVRRAGYALGKAGNRSAIPALIAALVTQHRYRVAYTESTPTFAIGNDRSIGFAGNSTGLTPEVEALARTGQLPYGAVVDMSQVKTVTKSTVVTRAQRNVEVLDALKSLSGENFGFDERTWQLWWAAHENGTGWHDE
ncbi:MAG: HEAT repeat domain-containing protein [Planctomycetaceae bacterium]|nr:HEAT repeat domain-containing protein [Planctomycetaceae bacterium]